MKGFLITIGIVFGALGIGMAGKWIELKVTNRWRDKMKKKEINERMNQAHNLAQKESEKGWDEFVKTKKSYTWNELKASGSAHYKTGGGVEPVDLYLAGDMLQDFALCSIIKYAFRSRRAQEIAPDLFIKNMNKIIDYAERLIAAEGEGCI